MARLMPLFLTLLILLGVFGMQVGFIAAHKDIGYLIVGAMLIFVAACATVVQVYLLFGRRQR